MLSAEFSTIRVEDVIVNRSSRIRKKITEEDILEMAASITRCGGLIHPIVIDRDNVLCAGERRLSGVRHLGWDRIPFQYLDTLSEREQLMIELEENVRRKDLDWKDKCDALLKFHELQRTEQESWALEDTAKAVGYSTAAASNMLTVAREVEAGNALVIAAPKFSTARAIVARKQEREASDMAANIKAAVKAPTSSNEILVTSFLDWAPKYSGPQFNFIHCDFPYGINFQNTGQGAVAEHGDYEDSEDVYWELLDCLITHIDKLMAESSHLIFWFAMNYYQKTFERLTQHFRVDPYPLIWFKSDNTGILPDFNRGPRRVYETAFFCSRGDRKVVQAVANAVGFPVTKVVGHASEKSQPMLEHFFRMVVDSNTRMLDPTCGSGSALRAAKKMGAQSILGLERDETFAKDALRALG